MTERLGVRTPWKNKRGSGVMPPKKRKGVKGKLGERTGKELSKWKKTRRSSSDYVPGADERGKS